MNKFILYIGFVFILLMSFCSQTERCHDEMISLLGQAERRAYSAKNEFNTKAKLKYIDSLLEIEHSSLQEKLFCRFLKADLLLEMGEESRAIDILTSLQANQLYYHDQILRSLAIAYLRLGERTNCIENHAAESCIMPIKGVGIHRDSSGSLRAIDLYKEILRLHPNDLESRWLLNIAYMTINKYPQEVPREYLILGMEGDTTERVTPFVDIAADVGLDVSTMAGGVIADDFDNDGYIDLILSSLYVTEELRYFRNNGNGTFTDLSESSSLRSIKGGLNIMQTDFNNDGYKDVFVLRGAWQNAFGDEPNSLIRNNGDGTFTDITTKSGLLSFHPTQTATWNDFNNDGFLDVYIGNESSQDRYHPAELFINNGNETFREVASQANCDVSAYIKGVTSGDYDNDGWVDLFLSTMSGRRILLHNKGYGKKEVVFEDVTEQAGIGLHTNNTFPTWFWDYDNDGWLDIFVCDYSFRHSLGVYEASEKLGIDAGAPDKMLLYHNNKDGTFTNVAKQLGLATNVFAMGANFGDINNDGFLDMYLGTGNPSYQSLVPNKMFVNKQGNSFAEVTASARVGHLQKGHGVAFADFDNDGDQDIYIEMGGAFIGDAYQNAMFLNPGQNENNWIVLDFEGTKANRSAIGSRVILHINEGGVKRQIVRDINSGGSFGSSPLRREIGLGAALKVDRMEIHWRGGKNVQVFENLPANGFYSVREGSDQVERLKQQTITWNLPNRLCLP